MVAAALSPPVRVGWMVSARPCPRLGAASPDDRDRQPAPELLQIPGSTSGTRGRDRGSGCRRTRPRGGGGRSHADRDRAPRAMTGMAEISIEHAIPKRHPTRLRWPRSRVRAAPCHSAESQIRQRTTPGSLCASRWRGSRCGHHPAAWRSPHPRVRTAVHGHPAAGGRHSSRSAGRPSTGWRLRRRLRLVSSPGRRRTGAGSSARSGGSGSGSGSRSRRR